MSKSKLLIPGNYYHIYNRGNNSENIFIEAKNYAYFLKLYIKHIEPVAFTYAYCLLRNHFHFLIRIKTDKEQRAYHQTSEVLKTSKVFEPQPPNRAFKNFFIAYSKGFNKTYNRTGSLFEHQFKRIHVNSDTYFLNLIAYIHQNPQKHGFVDDFRDWKWSSYDGLLSTGRSRLHRDTVIDWFGNQQEFIEFHRRPVDNKLLEGLLFEAQ